jgi:hypothetical protein
MTESPPAARVVATIKSCEQYRFRVDLPGTLDKEIRADIRRRALQETNETFLDCTRNFQSVAWVGAANLAFTDTRSVPSDSKSEFLHLLVCLKTVELSYLHFRESLPPADAPPAFAVEVRIPLRWAARKSLEKLCETLGIQLLLEDVKPGKDLFKSRIGGSYRSARHTGRPFTHEPIKRIEDLRAALVRRLSGVPPLKHTVNLLLTIVTLIFWPFAIAARVVFSLCYRVTAHRVLKRMECPRNTFVYFDLRLGRNRDVGAYLGWKYGTAFQDAAAAGSSVIPFTHIARPCNGYSLSAMWWAWQALKRMDREPLKGCVVVNYLIPPSLLLRLQFRRNTQCRIKRNRLGRLRRAATDFFTHLIYSEFISNLEHSKAFAMEISKGYQIFFALLSPGVVVQADAVAKTARNFTACARRHGGRVIYVADRICTSLRTSNQLIADEGDNPHLPNSCVVFDQVTRDEFVRQGVADRRIYPYHRNFAAQHAESSEGNGGAVQVVILLQAYEDNIGAMVRLGAEIAARVPKIQVLYQEHPNFPVCGKAKAKVLAEAPGRLRFLEPREPVNYARTLALITGYSTAAVPGILHGVPLIWLRRQIDNSIFCEAFLDRIGFAADKADEVVSILKRLMRRDLQTLQACVAATEEAKAIFTPSTAFAGRSLSEALGQALDDLFEEIIVSARTSGEETREPWVIASA